MKGIIGIVALIMSFAGVVGVWVFGIWSAVDFCLYLFKDIEFEWWTVWACAGSMAAAVISPFLAILANR